MDELKSLLYRHAIGQCSPEEEKRLDELTEHDPELRAVMSRLSDRDYVSRQMKCRKFVDIERPLSDIESKIAKNKPRRRPFGLRYLSIASAVLIIVGCTAAWFMQYSGKDSGADQNIALNESVVPLSSGTIRPGSVKAQLVAADGAKLNLSASDTSRLVTLGGKRAAAAGLSLNVPRGAEFKIVLEDSTEVWLNSESRLCYPQAFDEKERRVEVEGEAYFKVRHDESRPFYVDTKGMTVRVYGTSFNVKAYKDEDFVYTTLEKGAVSITTKNKESGELMLSPGHQAALNRESNKISMKVVDPSEVSAWHNGRFVLENRPLKEIMRDLSRWYDFEYRFADKSLEEIVFLGSIPRYGEFAGVKRMLEQTGGIRLNIEGNRVTVTQD